MTDYFQAQEDARYRTRMLIILFLFAVIAIILAVYGVVYVALERYRMAPVTQPGSGLGPNQQLFVVVALLTTALIGIGSLVRMSQLRRGGGRRVAEMLGGQRVRLNSTDELDRRLINVVEEMALASGTRVPAIYVLYESGINAFAAGYTTSDAAIGVTSGALDTLTREELQALVAHEFSHILNGDMRLNIRLIGVLSGILLIATVGQRILRSMNQSSRGRRNKGNAQVALLGLGLIAVGHVGVLFGRIIQSAASRQREYLADASAVQFTRNPGGLTGALMKIGRQGSRITSAYAQEASHLFFASGIVASAATFMATHPPLVDRIRRLDSTFKGELPLPDDDVGGSPATWVDADGRRRGASVEGAALMASIGAPTAAHLDYASELLRSLPDSVSAAAHDADGATALVFALLMHDGAHAAAQRATVAAHGGDELADRVASLAKDVASLGERVRLSLLDLLHPALQPIAPEQRLRIHQTAQALVAADERTDVFEFAVLHLVGHRLRPRPHELKKPGLLPKLAGTVKAARAPLSPPVPKVARTPVSVRDDIQYVLSAVAWSGTGELTEATRACMAGVAALPREFAGIALMPRDALSADLLDAALSRLGEAKPGIRRTLMEACVHGVAAADARVDMREAELLRAIGEALDFPMPPVVVSATAQFAHLAGAPAVR